MSLCMKKGCKRICKSFKKSTSKPKKKQRPTQIPTPTPNSILHLPLPRRQRNCTDQCLRNVHCEQGFICVPKGCRNICEKARGQSHLGPATKSQTNDCNDRCSSDIHCPFRYNCIQDGCKKVCRKPETTFSFFGTEPTTTATSNNCEIECMFDSDCPVGLSCFEEGCNTTCISKQPISTLSIQNSKLSPTIATSLSSERKTDECRDECKIDQDCFTGFYCRVLGCRKICKAAFGEELPPSPLPKTSVRNPTPTRGRICKNECSSDRECPIGNFCRQVGCSQICKTDLGSCTDECLSDADCSVGFKCHQKGCKRECIKRFITTTPIPNNCQSECFSSRDCDFGHVCAADGCKNICKQYRPSQIQRINQDILSNNCNIECSKDSDCLRGQNCIKDGCNRVCIRSQNNLSPTTGTCVDQCSRDTDCSLGSYCRLNGCRMECRAPERFPLVPQSESFNHIPSRSSGRFDNPRNLCVTECFTNGQCPRGSTCIQDGCNRTCEDQTLGRFNP